MVGKDKKGGASYLHKWWGWLVSILFKILRWIFSVEGVILLFAGGLMVFVVYEFFWWKTTEFFEVENAENAKSSQLLILTLGSIGAACGLILAARRSAKFSEQVDTAQKQVEIGQKQVEIGQKQLKFAQKQADTGQKQLFNEQLGRGAELLTRKEMVMRRTGIRVLEDLAETTINKPEQVELIMRIIHDFVHEKTSSPSEDEERLDIALGIRTLASLYNEVDKSDGPDGFMKLLNFSLCHLEKLDFRNAELQVVNFRAAKLEGANFDSAELEGANFSVAKLEGANFSVAKLEGANFNVAQLQGADFNAAKLEGANLISAQLQGANFNQAQLQGANFKVAKLEGADFKVAKLEGADFKGANLQWVDCMGDDFSDAKNLTEEQVKGMIFEVDAPPKLPDGLEQFLDKRRGYEWKEDPNNESDFNYYFVDSDAEWSGKRVDEWVREYLASIRDPEDAG